MMFLLKASVCVELDDEAIKGKTPEEIVQMVKDDFCDETYVWQRDFIVEEMVQ